MSEDLKIGAKMPDGTIYLGYHNKKDWFVATEDAKNASGKKLVMSFNEAAGYAKDLRAHGHADWRVPPGKNDYNEPDILGVMFNSKSVGAFKGTYDESGAHPSSWYWSSSTHRDHAIYGWEQRFSDGFHDSDFMDSVAASVRAVRAVPRP